MDYKDRLYSPLLSRFIQPDTVVPNPMISQSWNRFSYVRNNPINFIDPTGHWECNFDPDECAFLKKHNPGNGITINKSNTGGGSSSGSSGGNGGGEEEEEKGERGKGLASLKNSQSPCAEDPNCFLATQGDIILMSNAQGFLAGSYAVLGTIFVGMAGTAIFSVAPSGGMTITLTFPAVVLGFIGLALGAESIDSGSNSSYLESIALSMDKNEVIEMHKQESLFSTGYYTNEQNATHATVMPSSRITMAFMAFVFSLDDK